jgi:F-type H+-transporting ATPase subunit delta
MKISKHARDQARALFRACLVKGLPDEGRVLQVVRRAVSTKPRDYLAIIRHFQRLVKLDAVRRIARVESAVPLPGALHTSVQSSLARRYGPGLQTSFTPKAELLGGMRIQVGSDVYDGSVQGRLAALEQSF